MQPLDVFVLARQVDVDLERVVDLGQVVDAELDVDHRADDTGNAADAGVTASEPAALSTVAVMSSHSLPVAASASAPPTISLISWVMSAWRAAFASRV